MNKKLSSIFVILSLVLLFGCKSKQETNQNKAEDLVKEMLQKNLPDEKTYESVEFGDLDSVNLVEINDAFLSIKNGHLEKGRSYDQAMEMTYTGLKIFNSPLFEDPKYGYKISHKFRANNELGVMGISTYYFYIDSELSKILYSEEID
ncbi:hypothetical protein [Pedobacter agri]|uniref:hypothetical protein n=1 Tax=Pedobacter agri TaxID=454586 RepID=UPI00292DDA86|nr:hypothetical protein [Pedobacter agri]